MDTRASHLGGIIFTQRISVSHTPEDRVQGDQGPRDSSVSLLAAPGSTMSHTQKVGFSIPSCNSPGRPGYSKTLALQALKQPLARSSKTKLDLKLGIKKRKEPYLMLFCTAAWSKVTVKKERYESCEASISVNHEGQGTGSRDSLQGCQHVGVSNISLMVKQETNLNKLNCPSERKQELIKMFWGGTKIIHYHYWTFKNYKRILRI
ncbi:uncharacterized protein [Vicugna pacos]|uniref:Uncharacterized protein isoform X1 n=1 Tax=Vicugna pacos TaxID=30538 RepID=A0ABM5DLU5_VICPA